MASRTESLENNSQALTSWSNGNSASDIYWHSTTLYRHRSGKLFTDEHGGDAVYVNRSPKWLTEEEAIDLVYENATDTITGYHYSRSQAALIVSGKDPGKGYRD